LVVTLLSCNTWLLVLLRVELLLLSLLIHLRADWGWWWRCCACILILLITTLKKDGTKDYQCNHGDSADYTTCNCANWG
jgi:hypothetical protein